MGESSGLTGIGGGLRNFQAAHNTHGPRGLTTSCSVAGLLAARYGVMRKAVCLMAQWRQVRMETAALLHRIQGRLVQKTVGCQHAPGNTAPQIRQAAGKHSALLTNFRRITTRSERWSHQFCSMSSMGRALPDLSGDACSEKTPRAVSKDRLPRKCRVLS